MLHQIIELGLERRIGLCRAIFAFQIEDQRHQRFGDIASPKLAKMAAFVGHRPETVRLGSHAFVTRSEEHTSELQSLMRISYAVFCLKKKKTKKQLKYKQTRQY